MADRMVSRLVRADYDDDMEFQNSIWNQVSKDHGDSFARENWPEFCDMLNCSVNESEMTVFQEYKDAPQDVKDFILSVMMKKQQWSGNRNEVGYPVA